MTRIALVFDNRLRPETTGLYCRRALGELVRAGRIERVEHFLPDELDEIRADSFDLFLFIDDGLITEIPAHLKPAAYWAIDTHLNFARSLELAKQAEWTFAAQKPGTTRLQSAGIENAFWLPLACDPEIHRRRLLAPQCDIAFIGNVFPGERERLLNEIQQRYSSTFVGNRYLDEMAAVYSAAKVVFNRSLADDINMRVFEGLCSGSLVVTNTLPQAGQEKLFQDGQHLVTYDSDEGLWDKLEYYLSHEDERKRIANAGRQEVVAHHTYRQRMETLLAHCLPETDFNKTRVSEKEIRADIVAKPNDYFDHARPDVLELIPSTATHVFEVGCGGGRLGESLKARQPVHITGIEYDPVAAKRATTRLDQVLVGDLETDHFEIDTASFDCIVCADVLEHLRDPLNVLRKLREWLTPDGTLVTSLPNVRNHTVIQSLLAGNWTYESAGLLDADHVRFFTRREIEKLLFRAGFDVDEMRMVGGEGFSEWQQSGQPRELTIGGLQIRTSSPEEAAEFFAYQYLTRSRKSPERIGSTELLPSSGLPKTSIIIVTYNQLNYTRQCVDSIRLRTDDLVELIFVDNGSTDGTPGYLGSLPAGTIILNDANRGFPAAVNQAIAVAKGETILLLNNDTIVTTGWLERMLEALYSSPEIGLVGPVSNNVSGPQQIETQYGHLSELDGFAWDWGQQHRGERLGIERLVGFCLLFKREVVDRIGVLDERFGIGNFEDDDFCRRAGEAGYRCAIAVDSFVHHFGSVTFKGAGIDFQNLLAENQQKYRQKWDESREAQTTPVADAPPLHGRSRPKLVLEPTDSGLRLVPNTIKLSACLIVRNNENTIRLCLESVQPWVDEIIVVDTGSTDVTAEICRELGARVFHWAWRDSFAAARNESLDHARGEWIFWLDSDDTLPEECGKRLRELVDGSHLDNVLGYVAQVHCPGDESSDVTVVDHVKLIRNRPDLQFEFRIHEQIIPSIRRAGGEVAWSDIYVVHSGSDRTELGRAGKLVRDFKLLELELADRPEHPFVLFNLGMTHADVKQYEPAIDYLQRCLRVSGPDESHVRKAYALLIGALNQANRHDQAWDRVNDGLQRFPDDKELLFRQAMLHHHFGRLEEAQRVYLRILEEQTDRHFTSVDLGIAGFKTRHNLAIVYEDMGQMEAASRQWEQIVGERPDYLAGWRGWGENLLIRNARPELACYFRKLNRQPCAKGVGLTIQAKLAVLKERFDLACRKLAAAIEFDDRDVAAHNTLCRLVFEQAGPAAAIPHLERLLEVDPADASAWHNLGAGLMSVERWSEAIKALQRSIEIRPNSAPTLHLLVECEAITKPISQT